MLKMSYIGCPGPSPAVSAQFTLKMCVPVGIQKKSLKPLILGVQGHSRSSTLTLIKSLSLLLVMVSSICLPICNRFHATQD